MHTLRGRQISWRRMKVKIEEKRKKKKGAGTAAAVVNLWNIKCVQNPDVEKDIQKTVDTLIKASD